MTEDIWSDKYDAAWEYQTQVAIGDDLSHLFSDVLAYVKLTNADIEDADELIPVPVELVSLDSYSEITCFTLLKGELRLIKYRYEPYYYGGSLYEPPDEGIEFDWFWL